MPASRLHGAGTWDIAEHPNEEPRMIFRSTLGIGPRRAAGLRWLRRLLFLFSLALSCGLATTAQAQSGSNASNFQNGAQLSVNERTGDVTLAITLVRLPGIVAELGATLVLTYRSEDARSNIQSDTRPFGLPYGWSHGLSFIYNDGTSLKLNTDGTQVYQLDDGWFTSFTPPDGTPMSVKTGLRQYNGAGPPPVGHRQRRGQRSRPRVHLHQPRGAGEVLYIRRPDDPRGRSVRQPHRLSLPRQAPAGCARPRQRPLPRRPVTVLPGEVLAGAPARRAEHRALRYR